MTKLTPEPGGSSKLNVLEFMKYTALEVSIVAQAINR